MLLFCYSTAVLFGHHACNPFLGVGIVMVFMLGARSQEHPRLEATRVRMDLDDIIEKTLHLDTIQVNYLRFYIRLGRFELRDDTICRGVCRISQGGGGPNSKIFGNLDIHAAKRHVASSEASSRC